MKSPFPGMDPWLERSWGDVHSRLITSTSAAKSGSVTLKLTGPTEKGFGPFPTTLSYTITSGTGAFASASGSGSILVTLSGVRKFKFKLTSLGAPTLALNG
jgi:hypothetical protein